LKKKNDKQEALQNEIFTFCKNNKMEDCYETLANKMGFTDVEQLIILKEQDIEEIAQELGLKYARKGSFLISIKKLKQEYQINDKKKAEEELFKIKNVLTHEEQGYSDDSNKNKNENTNLKQKRKIFNDSDDFDKDFDRKKRKTEMKIINPANTFGTISYGGNQERNINKFFFKHY